MEILKGVSCFTNAEAPSMRMSNFFPLTKWVSVNMGGDPPTFVKARLSFGTPESAVSCIQHLQEWKIPETAEVVIFSVLLSPSSLAIFIPSPGITFCCCSAQVVAGIRYMMHTREQLFKRLEVVEAMHAFISHHPGGIEEMRSRLKRVEADLATAQKAVADGAKKLNLAKEEKGAIRAEANPLKGEREALEGQVKGVEQENSQLKKEVDELQASLAA